jgi:hypothetical protein
MEDDMTVAETIWLAYMTVAEVYMVVAVAETIW